MIINLMKNIQNYVNHFLRIKSFLKQIAHLSGSFLLAFIKKTASH